MTGTTLPTDIPLLFDRQRLARNRQRAAQNLSHHGVLFDDTAAELAERLSAVNRKFVRVLDLGSRHLSLSRMLLKADPSRFIVHAPSFQPVGSSIGIHSAAAEEEALPFAPASFDLVISNLVLHWVNDLPGCLTQIRSILKPDGFFLAALLGGATLYELRAALLEAEMEVRGGASAHVAPFAELRDAAALLQRAGFALPVADVSRLTLTYKDSFSLMHELRGMGEGNALAAAERRFMPRRLFACADEIYRKRFGDESGQILASFEIIYLAGWAPDQRSEIRSQKSEIKISS